MKISNTASKKMFSKYFKFKPAESVIKDDYIKKSEIQINKEPQLETQASLAKNNHNGAFIGMTGTFNQEQQVSAKSDNVNPQVQNP